MVKLKKEVDEAVTHEPGAEFYLRLNKYLSDKKQLLELGSGMENEHFPRFIVEGLTVSFEDQMKQVS